jgi:uncharacterized protein (UPF0303 family)
MSAADDIEKIAQQEAALVLPQFDHEMAWRIGSRLRKMAVARNLAMVIDVRRCGEQLFYSALAGTAPNNADWARRKGNVVAHFQRSSYAIGLEMEQKGTSLDERYALPFREYAAHGGSFPLRVSNVGVVGSVTVSGLPQREDHEFVVEALCLDRGQNYESLRLGPAE